MNLLFIIFRVSAAVAVITTIAFYYFNSDSLDSKHIELNKVLKNRNLALLTFEKDKNQSVNLLNSLLRERGKIRLEREEALTKSESIKEEVSLLQPKQKNLEEIKSKLTAEYEAVSKQLESEKRKLEKETADSLPLVEKESALKKELQELNKELEVVNNAKKSIDSDFAVLDKKREVAEEIYKSEREKLLKEIQVPQSIYYGDTIEVSIDNIVPSGAGFFSNVGINEGFREGMSFLCSATREIDSPLFEITTRLVQENLTFFEFLEPKKLKKSEIMQLNRKLFLIRSGESNTN